MRICSFVVKTSTDVHLTYPADLSAILKSQMSLLQVLFDYEELSEALVSGQLLACD